MPMYLQKQNLQSHQQEHHEELATSSASGETGAPSEEPHSSQKVHKRKSRPPVRYQPGMSGMETAVTLSATIEALGQNDYDDILLQSAMSHPISFKSTSDPDTMYYHEAMRAPDRKEFIKAMAREVQDHAERHHWEVIPRTEVPKDQKVLPAVWAMKRKCHIDTRKVYKWKARLNVHGGKQEYGVNYWETYSPVVNWSSIHLFLILAIINKWATRQIDFVQAFPQAPIQCDMYMEIPMGFEVDGDRKQHVLRLKQNLYGQKQAGQVWNEYLKEGLQCIGFTPSKVDECIFYKGTTIFLVYVDDCIIIDPISQ